MKLAFLSYSHHDAKVAEWLQRSLEHYKLPNNIANPIDPNSRYLRPIFRDRTDLSTGILSEIIDKNLEESKYLIIICSRRAAKSEWVSKEAQYFIEHGRMKQIIPLVVDGIPYSGGRRECMPLYMCKYVEEHPDQELLCIDMLAEGENRSFMQIVSRLVEVPFDVMYGRHRRRRNRLMFFQVLLGLLVIFFAGFFVTPIGSTVQLCDPINRLPHRDGVLMVGGVQFPIEQDRYDTIVKLSSLPGYMRGRTLDITFIAPFYDTARTQLDLGFGFNSTAKLELTRDKSFSVFAGWVLSEEGAPIRGAYVRLGSFQAVTDLNGYFCVLLPVEVQSNEQPILIQKDGYEEIIREDENPSDSLKYIMHPLSTL